MEHSVMSHPHRTRAPKLEPEVIERSQGSASLGGATLANHRGRVSGASVSRAGDAGDDAPTTFALCDGSQFTFTRFVDLPTAADA
jgi:hypothetical protein